MTVSEIDAKIAQLQRQRQATYTHELTRAILSLRLSRFKAVRRERK